jgi:hypothetical protein
MWVKWGKIMGGGSRTWVYASEFGRVLVPSLAVHNIGKSLCIFWG